jgi:hypothetical protein
MNARETPMHTGAHQFTRFRVTGRVTAPAPGRRLHARGTVRSGAEVVSSSSGTSMTGCPYCGSGSFTRAPSPLPGRMNCQQGARYLGWQLRAPAAVPPASSSAVLVAIAATGLALRLVRISPGMIFFGRSSHRAITRRPRGDPHTRPPQSVPPFIGHVMRSGPAAVAARHRAQPFDRSAQAVRSDVVYSGRRPDTARTRTLQSTTPRR